MAATGSGVQYEELKAQISVIHTVISPVSLSSEIPSALVRASNSRECDVNAYIFHSFSWNNSGFDYIRKDLLKISLLFLTVIKLA